MELNLRIHELQTELERLLQEQHTQLRKLEQQDSNNKARQTQSPPQVILDEIKRKVLRDGNTEALLEGIMEALQEANRLRICELFITHFSDNTNNLAVEYLRNRSLDLARILEKETKNVR